MSPLSFISQALEVFGSSQNVVLQRSAQLAKAFAAEALGLLDVASWGRDRARGWNAGWELAI